MPGTDTSAPESNERGWHEFANKNVAANTTGMSTGWYVLDGGFFWHALRPHVVSGPYSTQADAMTARDTIERMTVAFGRYWIDEVPAVTSTRSGKEHR